MKKRKEKRKAIITKISMGNLKDLIGPFLYQTKLLNSTDEIDSIFLDACYWEEFEETQDPLFPYSLQIWLKEGGVKDSTKLSKGDKI